MSAAAAWANTATATLWSRQSRDGWSGEAAFAAPVVFDCDYISKAESRRNAAGEEFTSRMRIYTERSDVKRGDFVLLGESTATDPTRVQGAREVKDIDRFSDTFDRTADDFVLYTV